MKVSVPSTGGGGLEVQVGEHFGRVPTYTIFDTETEEVSIVTNTSEHMGGKGFPPEILSRHGVNVLICSGLGQRAITMFQDMGIMVFVGAQGTVKDAIKMWQDGQLQAATDENACAQHAFRVEGSHEHRHHDGQCGGR